jgi:cobalt-zinc-cadmium efflux system outer membrane protein
VLTLDEALRLALANNPELRASGGRVEAAAGRADQARRWTNPELELASEDVPVRSGSFRDSKNTIGVAQTVPWPGKKKLDGRIGTAGVRLGEADLSLRRVELVRDVKTAFYRVLAAERLVAVAGELVQFAESSASTARKRVEAGAAADQEQLRAEIQLDQARTELAAFQRELVTARQELVTLLGRPDLSDAPLSGALVETPDAAGLDLGPERWLANHPSVVAARTVRDRTELELRRARLEPYPDVRVGVDGGREGREDNAIVQFRVSLPLPIVDRSKGRKREAEANVGVAEAELVATEQRLLREWGTVSQRFRTAAEQVATYRERILPKANTALRLVQTGFQEGKFGFIDLLDTQRTTAEARLVYQQKLLELNTAQAELEALLGATPVPGQSPISSQPK